MTDNAVPGPPVGDTPDNRGSEPGRPLDGGRGTEPAAPSPWAPTQESDVRGSTPEPPGTTPDPAAVAPDPAAVAPDPAAPEWSTLGPPLSPPEAPGAPLGQAAGAGSLPPPAWRDITATAPTWGEHLAVSAPPPATALPPRRRALLTAAASGALAGALVAGILVGVLRDDNAGGSPRVTFSTNTSKIARPTDIQGILARVEPAVVAIRTRTLSLGDFLRPVPGEGAGTGFVIGEDGVIVTNNHVVAGAQSIEVVFGNDRKMPARVLGRDPTTDLAVLKVDASGLAVAALGNSDVLRVGDDVVAIGNALALEGGPTVTRGIVSAKDRTIVAENGTRLEHVIQTDTAINPGNSGGPLVNSAGEVVGINTAVAGDAQNIGFSIAISQAKPIIDELRQGTARTRPFLGVNMFDMTPALAEELSIDQTSGALVVEVTEGSGAEVGGIRPRDVIVEIDGKKVGNASEVTAIVREHKPGDQLKITVMRGKDRQTLDVRLGERPVDVG
jgi:serine protease Do